MAKYNEILTGRHNKFLTKYFSMKGAAPAPQLAGDISANIALFKGNEARFLESWDLCGVSNTIAANVAQSNAILLRNPVGSNIIGVLFKIMSVGGAIAGEIDLSIGPSVADLAAPFASFFFDSRAGRIQPTLKGSSSNLTPGQLAGIIGRVPVGANAIPYEWLLEENMEIPILPGTGVQVQNTTANDALSVTFWWRERTLEESERQ